MIRYVIDKCRVETHLSAERWKYIMSWFILESKNETLTCSSTLHEFTHINLDDFESPISQTRSEKKRRIWIGMDWMEPCLIRYSNRRENCLSHCDCITNESFRLFITNGDRLRKTTKNLKGYGSRRGKGYGSFLLPLEYSCWMQVDTIVQPSHQEEQSKYPDGRIYLPPIHIEPLRSHPV